MLKQNKKLRKQLPEIQKQKMAYEKEKEREDNRMMSQIFSKVQCN
jgi:hypothetical protein